MVKEEILKKIEAVKKEIHDTPYDKSSQFHHGVLKAKLSKLKDMLEDRIIGGNGGSSGGGYAIKHSGDASVVLVGLPSVGKSTLLNKITNAASKVGNYDFTTLGVIPGMMEHRGVRIQMLDLPGIIEGAAGNKGFGKKVISVVRASDMVIIMTDIKRVEFFETVENELYQAGIRLNTRAPKVSFTRTDRGSVQVIDPYRNFDKQMVAQIAKELGFDNVIITIGEKLANVDRLIDGLSKNRKYMPAVKLLTKIDLGIEAQKVPNDCIPISAEKNVAIEELKDEIWRKLGLVRVYLKRERNGIADRIEPMIMRRGQNMDDVLGKISMEMKQDVNRVYVWGEEVKFPGQEVSFSFPVFDEMEVWFGR